MTCYFKYNLLIALKKVLFVEQTIYLNIINGELVEDLLWRDIGPLGNFKKIISKWKLDEFRTTNLFSRVQNNFVVTM